MPSRDELRAQAIVEVFRRGRAADPSTARATVTEMNCVLDADHVDELDPILVAVLDPAHGHTGDCLDGGHRRGRRTGVDGSIGAPVTRTGSRQVWFTPSHWELLVCNADISEVLLDRLGEPIAVRNRVRFPNRAMRRTLDADHGDTVTSNLTSVCENDR